MPLRIQCEHEGHELPARAARDLTTSRPNGDRKKKTSTSLRWAQFQVSALGPDADRGRFDPPEIYALAREGALSGKRRKEALLPRAGEAVALRRRRLRHPVGSLADTVYLAGRALRSRARLRRSARARA